MASVDKAAAAMLSSRELAAATDPTAIMTIKEMIEDTKLGESTVYQHMAKNEFPSCFNLVGRKTVWLKSEVIEWERWRIDVAKGNERWQPPPDEP